MTEQTDPRVNDITVFPQSTHPDSPYGGMMLRDLFAAAALAGMGTWMPAGCTSLNHERDRDERAYWAYQQADAMLRERGK